MIKLKGLDMSHAITVGSTPFLKSDEAQKVGFVRGLLVAKKGNTLAVVKCYFPEETGKITQADLECCYPGNKIQDGQSGVHLWETSKGTDLLLEVQDAKAYTLPNQMMFVYPNFEKPMDIQAGEPMSERGVMTFSKMPESQVDIITEPSEKTKDIDGKINDFLEKKFNKKFDKTGRILGVGALGAEYGLLKILEATSAVGDVVETTKKTVKGIRADKKTGEYEKGTFFKRWKRQFVSDKEKGELIFQQTRTGIGNSKETSRDFIKRMGKMIKGR